MAQVEHSDGPHDAGRNAVRDPLWPPAFGAWIKVGVLYQRTSQYLATRLRPLGLTVAQFDALANLYVGDDIAQNELAARLLVTKGNMTGLVRRLVDHGWVSRTPDPYDGRIQRLRLTSEGRELAVAALLVQRTLVEEMMGDLTRAERESLRSLLARCIERVESIRDSD